MVIDIPIPKTYSCSQDFSGLLIVVVCSLQVRGFPTFEGEKVPATRKQGAHQETSLACLLTCEAVLQSKCFGCMSSGGLITLAVRLNDAD